MKILHVLMWILLTASPLFCDMIELGGSYTYVHLRVPKQPSFHGNLGGIQGNYAYQAENGFYAGARAAWKQGKTDSSWAARKLVYVDAQERLGYTYQCPNWKCTFFSGLGYRYLHHRLNQSHQPAIKFAYHEFYVPVGLLSEYALCNWCTAGLNFIWMPQIFPTVQITPLKGARWVLTNTLNNLLVELPVTFLPNSCYSIVLKPFFEYWRDGHSTAKTLGGERLGLPGNRYHFWGIEINLAASF